MTFFYKNLEKRLKKLKEIVQSSLPHLKKEKFSFAESIDYATSLIAQLKNELEKAQKTNFHLQTILQSLKDILIISDEEGKIKSINQTGEKILGYKEEEIKDKSLSFLWENELLFKELWKKIIKEESVSDYQINLKTKEGKIIPLSLSVSIIKCNKRKKMILLFKDIRHLLSLAEKQKEVMIRHILIEEKKKRKEILKKVHQEMESSQLALLNVIEDLIRKREELEKTQSMLIQAEKLSAIGQIASGVAHEVKNPLGVIIQGVDYLEKSLSQNPQEVKKVLEMMRKNVKRADNIIQLLLNYSKVKRLDIKPDDINSILEEALTLVNQRLKFENIQIIKELNSQNKVLVDRPKIEQVFINILLNAVQAIPYKGKIFIRSYDTTAKKVENIFGEEYKKGFEPQEDITIAEVEDTGVGIAEENLKKVFEPFFTTKLATGGTGLGLAVSYRIITLHKGLIKIKSQVGKGTKVIVGLKVAKKE